MTSNNLKVECLQRHALVIPEEESSMLLGEGLATLHRSAGLNTMFNYNVYMYIFKILIIFFLKKVILFTCFPTFILCDL